MPSSLPHKRLAADACDIGREGESNDETFPEGIGNQKMPYDLPFVNASGLPHRALRAPRHAACAATMARYAGRYRARNLPAANGLGP